eukprot:UN21821
MFTSRILQNNGEMYLRTLPSSGETSRTPLKFSKRRNLYNPGSSGACDESSHILDD